MAINKDSNAYTIIFAIAMCVVVGTSLVIVSQTLKPVQEKNVMNDKKQNILAAIQVEATLQDAGTKFEQYVKDAVILDANSQAVEVKSDVITEALTINALSEFKDKPATDRKYPLFICEKDGSRFFVMPVGGQGLWAGVWGYVAVGEDLNTIAGASFDHKSETPGLGAEIATPFFETQFTGKKIHDDNGEFVSIRVVKPGGPKSDHAVDGISGGTFTSVGVDEMLMRCMSVYSKYFKTMSKSTALN